MSFFLGFAGIIVLIIGFLAVFITACGLFVGEDPVTWWKGFLQ